MRVVHKTARHCWALDVVGHACQQPLAFGGHGLVGGGLTSGGAGGAGER